MTDIGPYVQIIVARCSEAAAKDPGLPARTIQFTFTDTGDTWVVRLRGGEPATALQEKLDAPDVSVTAPTDVMADILDKKLNGTMAYMQRKIQVKGAMDDLLRLQRMIM